MKLNRNQLWTPGNLECAHSEAFLSGVKASGHGVSSTESVLLVSCVILSKILTLFELGLLHL